MWSASRLAIGGVMVLLAATAHAGFPFQSREQVWESHRNHARRIGLATLLDVRQLSQDEVHEIYGPGLWSHRPAFALRVKFKEIFRGAPADKRLDVPFAFIPVPDDPRDPRLPRDPVSHFEGCKAIVIVHPGGGRHPERPIVHIEPVSSCRADELVEFWRKLTGLWNTTDIQERRRALRLGCRDCLPRFQDYCCRRLANWRGVKADHNAAEQMDRLAALPVIWKRFVDPDVPLQVLATCDEILGGVSPGWRNHPTRYDVMAAALGRHSRLDEPPFDGQVDHQLFEQKLSALSHFPGRERKTYQLFEEVMESALRRYHRYILTHLSHLYRPHSQDRDQQRLNQEIWRRLTTASGDPFDRESAKAAAAHAIDDIASDYAFVGHLPERVSKVLAGAENSAFYGSFRRDLPEMTLAAPRVEQLRKEGYANLTVPTRSQLGEKVVFVTRAGLGLDQDPIFGHGVWSSWRPWYGEAIWIEKPADWPEAGTGLIVVTGTLAERHDVPAFRLDANAHAPFQVGLPVPVGSDADQIRHRFVVVDVQWELVKNAVPR